MEIWTAATPNGWKVSIMLEELKEAGIELPEIEIKTINLSKGEQFTELFTRHNLNQKIPVLIDGERSIMESLRDLAIFGREVSNTHVARRRGTLGHIALGVLAGSECGP